MSVENLGGELSRRIRFFGSVISSIFSLGSRSKSIVNTAVKTRHCLAQEFQVTFCKSSWPFDVMDFSKVVLARAGPLRKARATLQSEDRIEDVSDGLRAVNCLLLASPVPSLEPRT